MSTVHLKAVQAIFPYYLAVTNGPLVLFSEPILFTHKLIFSLLNCVFLSLSDDSAKAGDRSPPAAVLMVVIDLLALTVSRSV